MSLSYSDRLGRTCYEHGMLNRKPRSVSHSKDQDVLPDMPCYVATETEFLAAVDVGLADIEAGRTVAFDTFAANMRRAIRNRN